MRIHGYLSVMVVVTFMAGARTASAQAYNTDARKLGMGGAGSATPNVAFGMVAPADAYGVIPIPIGLFQVFSNLDTFNPSSDEFNPVLALELASSPLNYTFGRLEVEPVDIFVTDLVNGDLNRDLSTYRVFVLESQSAQGLASGGWGKTFKFAKRDNGAFQGFYIGAGPYLSFDTQLDVDPKLTQILGSETPVYFPNDSLKVLNASAVQLALSITFGYRARFAFPGESVTPPAAPAAPAGGPAPEPPSRDGIYVAANYRYLRGFHYLEPDTTVRFDTNAQGLVVLNPTTTPLVIEDLEASTGRGRAVDVGMEVVRGPWQAGVGVSGIGNKIDWSDLTRKRFTLNSLFAGGDFVDQEIPTVSTNVPVKLPVVTTGNFGYDGGDWAFSTDATHGYNGNSFHGGVERRLGSFALRGGARVLAGQMGSDVWLRVWPQGGVGRRGLRHAREYRKQTRDDARAVAEDWPVLNVTASVETLVRRIRRSDSRPSTRRRRRISGRRRRSGRRACRRGA